MRELDEMVKKKKKEASEGKSTAGLGLKEIKE